MKVIGLDVCKLSVVACVLTQRPPEPRQFYYEAQYFTFAANAAGIRGLLALEPDLAVMEPTGVNYAKLWGTHLARAGVEVRLVGHTQLRGYRANHLELPDKDDQADALALACYGFDYLEQPRKFVQLRQQPIVRIRELALRLGHLNRVQSPIVNRMRQDLAWQFPEVADCCRSHGHKTPLLWSWLACERESAKYSSLYEKTCGLGLTNEVKVHAKRLCNIHAEERALELELRQLMKSSSSFDPYREVFTRFGFGERTEALILSQIYPLENYLGSDGKPIVVIRPGRNSGKPTKRYLSRRRFEKSLGCAPTEESSGSITGKKIVGGSDLCRIAMWLWVFTRIEPHKSRLNNYIGECLGNYLDETKANRQPIKLARMKTASRAVRLLFKELTNEVF